MPYWPPLPSPSTTAVEVNPNVYNGYNLQLSSIPNLSGRQELTRCFFNNNDIHVIHEQFLPPNVKEVCFYGNRIHKLGLPDRWPQTLKIISLERNDITNTNETIEWPQDLETLSLDDNPLYEQPKRLPENLDLLSMSYTKLKTVSELPKGLKKLRAYYSQIQTVGPLPPSLEYLNLGYNQLKTPSIFRYPLPKTLVFLNLDYNNLTQIPENLPDSIQTLSVVGNKLISLPKHLPAQLRLLIANKNRIREFTPIWKPNQRLFQFHIRDNCVTENLIILRETDKADDVFQANNWNQDIHHIYAYRIQKALRVYRLKKAIRVWARYKRIVDELVEVAYSPELVTKYHDIESLRKYITQWI
jgi:Leucine-rich repeat (LRR) protein